ncbi:DcaP family trimeric outer membrane transporter [Haloferula sp. BvORR071]|uniref:DcaP family trimeric outer membrane transporter n=1 Tax=Haloferula sp. BvORR071 TaxID=1396141 RepID=UPI000695E219|nr:DcaP family trimeric outer membrane transporter [Haloferula sp. BvORR071]
MLSAPIARGDDVEEMKQTLAAMEKTISDLKTRIAVLEDEKAEVKVAAPPAPSRAHAAPSKSEPSKSSPPAPALTTPAVVEASPGAAGTGSKVRDSDGFQELQQAAPRPENRPLDPKLKGFVLIPGTDTMFKIGGSARVDAIADFEDNGNPNQFVPSTIPVGNQAGYSGDERSTIHGKGTRISLEIRRPTEQFGNLRIYNENDFFGDSTSNTMTFRVRHFYGQAWNFLIGQTFSGFMNPDAWPDVIDYQGPVGIINRRQAQIRYTQPLWDDCGEGQAYISLEYPESDLLDASLPANSEARSSTPDVVIGGRWEGDLGNIQLAGIGRSLNFDSDTGADGSTMGWGVSLSGAWHITEKDDLLAQLAYGEGIARYVNDFNGNSLDAVFVGGDLEAVPIFAPMVGYTHRWSEHFRSTVAASWVMADLPAGVNALTPETTASIGANLVWQPTSSFRMGLEYLYGTKETYDGTDGDANRLNFVVRYDLVK